MGFQVFDFFEASLCSLMPSQLKVVTLGEVLLYSVTRYLLEENLISPGVV